MTIGQNIKRFRRNAGMTQEELAEMLSISPQAVSRWETDSAMPDISLIAPLTSIFGVTADELLGIDVFHLNEKTAAYKDRISALYRAHEYQEMLALSRLANKEIPNNMELVGQLAFALTSGENASQEKNIDEAILLYQSILDKSVDNVLRFRAACALCRLYKEKKNNKEKALFYARQLPKGYVQTSSFLIQRYGLLDDAEKEETCKYGIEEYTHALTNEIHWLADPDFQNSRCTFTIQQRIDLLQKEMDILKIVYGDKLLSVNREFYELNRIIGCLYLMENNHEKALDYFDMAVEYAISFDRYQDGEAYSSIMLADIETDAHNLWNDTACENMLNRILTQSRYDVLKGNPRFEKMIDTLENH